MTDVKPKYIRIDAVVLTSLDEEAIVEKAEQVLDTYFNVEHLSVFEVVHLPSFADQVRERMKKCRRR